MSMKLNLENPKAQFDNSLSTLSSHRNKWGLTFINSPKWVRVLLSTSRISSGNARDEKSPDLPFLGGLGNLRRQSSPQSLFGRRLSVPINSFIAIGPFFLALRSGNLILGGAREEN